MRLARSRTAAGITVPLVASGGRRWFPLSPLTAEIEPEALSAGPGRQRQTFLAA